MRDQTFQTALNERTVGRLMNGPPYIPSQAIVPAAQDKPTGPLFNGSVSLLCDRTVQTDTTRRLYLTEQGVG